MTTTNLLEDDAIRHIVLPNQSTYSPYCSELLTSDVIVGCRAIGDPEPTIDIYREHDDGSQQRFYELYRGNGELVVSHSPIRYGQSIVFHCNASNIASFVSISINWTYTCKWFVVTYIIYLHICTDTYIHLYTCNIFTPQIEETHEDTYVMYSSFLGYN